MTNTSVLEKTTTRINEAGKWNVIFHNDNVTSMEFVVMALMQIFNHNIQSAAAIMIHVHENGQGIAGTYTKEIAEQKMFETAQLAKQYGYPLRVSIQEV